MLEFSPALVKNLTWDVMAWNRAAASVLTDYSTLEPRQRNIMRLLFGRTRAHGNSKGWEDVARTVVAAFRADVARLGNTPEVEALVEELCQSSPDFSRMWRDNDVRNFGEGTKRLRHPEIGWIGLEYASFAVDGRPDLGLVIYNPATASDAERIRQLVARQSA